MIIVNCVMLMFDEKCVIKCVFVMSWFLLLSYDVLVFVSGGKIVGVMENVILNLQVDVMKVVNYMFLMVG